jgi:alpha-beta hydrolase superfamily lysophospholipase
VVATVIVVNGGGFVWPGWADMSLCRALARHRFRAVNLVYPLHDLPGAARATMRAVHRERRRGLPVFVVGLSVGGTLAELAAVEGEVDGAVAVAAPTDLLSWAPGGAVAGQQWSDADAYWRDVGASRAQRRAASPVYQVRDSAAPLLLFHSPDDEVVPIAQANALVDRVPSAQLRQLGGAHLQSQAFRKPALSWLRSLAWAIRP